MRDCIKKPPVCLSIAGLDPSGGAGILADVKTFEAFGCFGAAAVSSITFQNTVGVFGAEHQSAEAVRSQVQPVFDDYEVAALKSGMLPTREVISEVARLVSANNATRFVVDPVVRSTSGFDLIDDDALKALIHDLFPLAAVVTPNIPEAERIVGSEISTRDHILEAGKAIESMGPGAVLIKGGHLTGTNAEDILFCDGDHEVFTAEFIQTRATHGTGCTLSAAICSGLALGKDLSTSVRIAKEFVHRAISTAPGLGKGSSPINISG